MTTLYTIPFTCSQAALIVARELGLELTVDRVDRATKVTASGRNFLDVNPLGYVPVLELDDGTVLTEVAAVLTWLCDQRPGVMLPPPGTREAAVALSQLAFVSTEVHKTFSILFNSKAPEDFKAVAKEILGRRFAVLDQRLATQPFMLGESFSAVDAYLFVVVGWSRVLKIDLAEWPNLKAFTTRVLERPNVRAVIDSEKVRV